MLINLRNALMAGKRLPYDAEVEYLESSGTQWIDTGVVGGSSSKVEISASSTNTAKNMGLFGTRNASWLKAFTIWQRVTNTSVRFDFADDTTNRVIANAAWDTSGVNTVIKDGPNNTLNGVAGENNNTTTFTCEYTFYLFSINTAGTATANASARVYSCKIWQNGILIRDFIPVRKGTVGYLYDRVSGKLFGNAGTGDFVLGQDVVPVEYIESTGTQYIDTGLMIAGATDFEYEIVTTPIDLASNQRIFSSDGNTPNYSVLISLTNFSATPMSNTLAATNGKKATITYKNGVSTITSDGQTSTATYSFTTPTGTYGLVLFRRTNNAASAYFYKGRLHSATFTVGQDRHAYMPIRVGSGTTWEGAMIDTLTRRIYRNAGTGAFGYGNDLKYPIPAE